jgi:hypothetical protein
VRAAPREIGGTNDRARGCSATIVWRLRSVCYEHGNDEIRMTNDGTRDAKRWSPGATRRGEMVEGNVGFWLRSPLGRARRKPVWCFACVMRFCGLGRGPNFLLHNSRILRGRILALARDWPSGGDATAWQYFGSIAGRRSLSTCGVDAQNIMACRLRRRIGATTWTMCQTWKQFQNPAE